MVCVIAKWARIGPFGPISLSAQNLLSYLWPMGSGKTALIISLALAFRARRVLVITQGEVH